MILFSKGPKILTTGMGALNLVDGQTSDGLQKVFATNLFGHFVMVCMDMYVLYLYLALSDFKKYFGLLNNPLF